MKLLFLTFLVSFSLYGQKSTILTEAIVRDCFNHEYRTPCSRQLLEEILINTIHNELIIDLPLESKNYFSLSTLFVTGKDGKVIPEFTEARSESNKLKENTITYINTSMPTLLPKNTKFSEQRSVHIANMTFIKNPATGNYYHANQSDIEKNNIRVNYYDYDTVPLYSNCEQSSSMSEQFKCTIRKLSEYLKKNYKRPPSKPGSGVYVNMIVEVVVDSDGKVSVESIMGSAPDVYEYEVYRVINTLPVLQPATIKGIKSSIVFSLERLLIK